MFCNGRVALRAHTRDSEVDQTHLLQGCGIKAESPGLQPDSLGALAHLICVLVFSPE